MLQSLHFPGVGDHVGTDVPKSQPDLCVPLDLDQAEGTVALSQAWPLESCLDNFEAAAEWFVIWAEALAEPAAGALRSAVDAHKLVHVKTHELAVLS